MKTIGFGLLCVVACAAFGGGEPERREAASLVEAAASGDFRGVSIPANGADACAAAPVISGYGDWSFDLAGSTTDGVGHGLCSGSGSDQIWRDRWWLWTASANGPVRVETCGLTTLDTRIAVYAPASVCPPADEYILACDDDGCGGLQSTVTFIGRAGQEYLIRVGRWALSEPAAAGTGMFRVSGPASPDICPDDVILCQDELPGGNAHTSTSAFRVADDLRTDATGDVTGLCWWGSYIGTAPSVDGFTITYWTNSGGQPGSPIATYSQSDGTLAVQRADSGDVNIVSSTMFAYSASHAPLAFPAGARRWVEIRNFFGGTWFWQESDVGNGAWQDPTVAADWSDSDPISDRAFCVHFQSGCVGDTNGDGVINFADLNNVVSFINSTCP